MTIAILADQQMKDAWLKKKQSSSVEIAWCGSVKTLVATVADAYIDLIFVHDKERSKDLAMRRDFPFFVNEVEHRSSEIGDQFIRINGWPGFLERDVVELVAINTAQQEKAKKVFDELNWNYKLVPDVPGMITARIVASIINEAYHTFGEDISSKEDIDTAMKLGTNYPFGPFEWAEKIGLERVHALLKELYHTDKRYVIAPALEKEILQRHTQ